MQQSKKYFFLILLVAVLVVPSITLAAWWNPFSWGMWNSIFHFNQQAQKAVQQQKLVGNDKDAHGCIGSAGYSWCEAKQKCLRPWEEKCETTTAQQTIKVTSPNGGEAITQGQKVNITWSSTGLSSSDKVFIMLLNYTNVKDPLQQVASGQILADKLSNTLGLYNWTVFPNINSGSKYKIVVQSGKIKDDSDNFFTINGAVINGACGPAAKTYDYSDVVFIGNPCASGTMSPKSFNWPEAGKSFTWACQGINGGTNVNCTAVHSAQ